jgi:hypothetical protein
MTENTLPQSFRTIDSPDFKRVLFTWFAAEAGTPSEDAYQAILDFVDSHTQLPSVTLNARQLQAALALANPDGDADPAQWETVVTLTERLPFRADDESGVGQDCSAGLYLHFDDMPDEGMQLLSPDSEPAA